MSLLFICVKIFFARILDVSISTLRQMVMLKGKLFISTILAFIEVFIWFVVAREALTMDINSILIPIFYSLGYATGTLIGSYLAKCFVKGEVCIQIICNDEKLLKALKLRGYEVSAMTLDNKKKMLYLEVNSKSLKKVETLIKKADPTSFIIFNDSRKVINGMIK